MDGEKILNPSSSSIKESLPYAVNIRHWGHILIWWDMIGIDTLHNLIELDIEDWYLFGEIWLLLMYYIIVLCVV